MKFILAVFLSAILISPFSAFAATQITFTADAQAKNPVKLVFNGKQYNDKRTFLELKKAKAPLTAMQRFIMKVIEVNTSGGKNQILSLWAPKERAKIKKLVDDVQSYKKNVLFYKNVLSSRLVAYMDLGDYSICYVEHDVRGIGKFVKVYPVLHFKKRLYLSNGLTGNFFFKKFAYPIASYYMQ